VTRSRFGVHATQALYSRWLGGTLFAAAVLVTALAVHT